MSIPCEVCSASARARSAWKSGILRQPQPCRRPTFHQKPWPLTGQPFSHNLEYLRTVRSSSTSRQEDTHARPLGGALDPALEHISRGACRRGHRAGEEGGKGVRADIVLELGARQDHAFRSGISGSAYQLAVLQARNGAGLTARSGRHLCSWSVFYLAHLFSGGPPYS